MKKLIIILLVLSSTAFANDENSFAKGLLATGKLTGNCGIFKLQLDFQDNTELKGGEDFLARFWTMEAARLGLSLEEFVNNCHKIVEKYNTYYSMLDDKVINNSNQK